MFFLINQIITGDWGESCLYGFFFEKLIMNHGSLVKFSMAHAPDEQ